jgi:hypothetical protein
MQDLEEPIDNDLIDNNGDVFWAENYKILFLTDKLTEFFPSMHMDVIEKLNALFRLSIYLSVLLYLLTKNYLYFYIAIIVGAFTVFIYYNKKDSVELYFNSIPNSDENIIAKEDFKGDDKNENRLYPTVENPFCNVDLIYGDKTLDLPKPSWNNEELMEDIEKKFNYNLYRGVDDIYGKSNSQRQFFTVNSPVVPNTQSAFAKWLYSPPINGVCKTNTTECMVGVPTTTAVIDSSNPYPSTDVKY